MAKNSQAVLNKRSGAGFEGEIRSSLKEMGQFLYVKGVSCKGIDIFALKANMAFFLELKSHTKITNTLKKDAIAQFFANQCIVNDFITKTVYTPDKVLYTLLMYERNNYFSFSYLDRPEVIYQKEKMAISKSIEIILTNELNSYFNR